MIFCYRIHPTYSGELSRSAKSGGGKKVLPVIFAQSALSVPFTALLE